VGWLPGMFPLGIPVVHGLAAVWIPSQSWPVSYVVCALLLPPHHLPNPLGTTVIPLALLTPLLPWTAWIAHKPLAAAVDTLSGMVNSDLLLLLLSPLSFWVLPLRPQGCCPNPTLPVLVPRYLACLVLQTWSVKTRYPFLVYMPHPAGDLCWKSCIVRVHA
jgi:hypothetical protein